MPYIIRPMEMSDIPEVMAIEKLCFSMPWPAHAYRRELRDNRLSRYIVAEWVEPESAPARATAAQTTEQRSLPSGRTQTKEGAQKTSGETRSLVKRALSHLLPAFGRVEEPGPAPRLAGYAGFWLMLDEAHVTTIAVHPSLRGQGIGELLFIGLLDMGAALGAQHVTLEVRISNSVAQQLYRKFGFKDEGVRRRYYSDNGEDALIMWSELLGSPPYLERLARIKAELDKKLEHAKPPES